LDTGSGNNTITVQATTGPLTIGGAIGGTDRVLVGDAGGSVQAIRGALLVEHLGGSTNLPIDNTNDSTSPPNWALRTDGFSGFMDNLAPAEIQYYFITSVDVFGGDGTDIFTISNTLNIPTSLYTGSGQDRVRVQATTGPLEIVGFSGTDNITVG